MAIFPFACCPLEYVRMDILIASHDSSPVLWQLTRLPLRRPEGVRRVLHARTDGWLAASCCHIEPQSTRLSSMTIPCDTTLRFFAAAQVQAGQRDPSHARSATQQERSFVAKNEFRDITSRRQNSVCVIAPIASAIAETANFVGLAVLADLADSRIVEAPTRGVEKCEMFNSAT